ncbi:MAG: hypothetical protein K0R17_623 [Rariglobus sp.]|jgi:hypothetical protein|nr:hypothetical protein [Rariglobus sp.]
MSFPLLTPLAQAAPAVVQAGQPLFGSLWLALLAVLGGIAVLLVLVALLGRWLAATHPAPLLRPAQAAVPVAAAPEVTTAIIAASITAALGDNAKVAAVKLVASPAIPSVEMLMQQWSMEGRRQIYSSHKVR